MVILWINEIQKPEARSQKAVVRIKIMKQKE
jgi:hypothetical protein